MKSDVNDEKSISEHTFKISTLPFVFGKVVCKALMHSVHLNVFVVHIKRNSITVQLYSCSVFLRGERWGGVGGVGGGGRGAGGG